MSENSRNYISEHNEIQLQLQEVIKERDDIRAAYNEALSILMRLTEAVSVEFDLESVCELVMDLARKVIPNIGTAIFINDDSGNLSLKSERDMSDIAAQKILGLKEDGILDWALQNRKITNWPKENETEGSYILAPLIAQNKHLGILCLDTEIPSGEFLRQDEDMLKILATQAANAISNALLYEGLEQKNRTLASMSQYLENIYECLTSGLVVIDNDGFIRTFSVRASELLCIDNEKVKDAYFQEVFNQALIEKFNYLIENTREYGKTLDFDLDNPYINEKGVPLGFTATLLEKVYVVSEEDSFSKKAGTIILIQDLSESKELAEMKRLQKMKEELISNVSHELRTPLTSIKAYVETLISSVDEDDVETRKEFLKVISDEAERLTRLINDLLDLSKMEAKSIKYERNKLDIVELTRHVLMVQKELADQRNIELSCESNYDRIEMWGDKDRISQVLTNLVSNAIKYNKDNGKVIVKLKKKPTGVTIVVEDTGIGIDKKHIPMLFEKFFRVDSSLTYEVSGTGIGLSIVKHIIEMHGGTINVESEVGKGSRFIVFFPQRESSN